MNRAQNCVHMQIVSWVIKHSEAFIVMKKSFYVSISIQKSLQDLQKVRK